jgi:hypothetical protein
MQAGLIIILIGTLFLLRNVGVLFDMDWGLIWPLIVILLGLSMLKTDGKKGWCTCWGGKCDDCKKVHEKYH